MLTIIIGILLLVTGVHPLYVIMAVLAIYLDVWNILIRVLGLKGKND